MKDTDAATFQRSRGRERNGHRAVNQATRAALRSRPSDRFFLYVHYMDAHDYRKRDDAYADGVRMADAGVGALVALLEAEDLLDGAVVVLTADHGERPGETHWTEGRPWHRANPAFEEVLGVPLVVSPALFPDPRPGLRSDDVHRLVLRIAGAEAGEPELLEPGELALTERDWQTYRSGGFKLHRRRRDGRLHLVDLARDPTEQRDVAAEHPERVRRMAARLEALADALRTRAPSAAQLTPEDRRRLEALGYLEAP